MADVTFSDEFGAGSKGCCSPGYGPRELIQFARESRLEQQRPVDGFLGRVRRPFSFLV